MRPAKPRKTKRGGPPLRARGRGIRAGAAPSPAGPGPDEDAPSDSEGGAAPSPQRRPPAPPALLAPAGPRRWAVRLEAFAYGAGHPPVAGPARLRDLVAARAAELRALGADADPALVPDDLLLAAAAAGALVAPPFLDILEGGCFALAPCLCCYASRSARDAREADAALALFRRYYDARSYLESRAFVRVVAALLRDPGPDELAGVAAHLAALDSTPGEVREINERWAGRLCVATPGCQPGVLWVYSSADGRRLLRHLARGLRRGGAPVKVTVASSDARVYPRFRYRMYAAALAGGLAGGTGLELLHAALEWARNHAPA